VTSAQRVWAAQGDAWVARGRLFAALGGAVAELPGVRVVASGLNQLGKNGGDVHDPEAVPLDDVRTWFAERRVEWGLRLPAETPWPHGRRLFRQRCMVLDPVGFRPVSLPPGVDLRTAGPIDLALVAALDAVAFGGVTSDSAAWMAPTLGARGIHVAVASLDGVPVGTATSVVTDDWAGPAVGLFGVAVVPEARRRGIGGAVSSWLLERAFADGARLAHLNPDTDGAARLYARLGFAESCGFDVYAQT
jgi:GNAT superfamily N-acetyltransferase